MKPWQKKEKKDAKDFGGKVTPRSGGYFSFPGDVVTKDYLIDSKTTDKNRFSVTKQMWEKIDGEALKSRKIPILSAMFGDSNIEIVILGKWDFLQILKQLKIDNQ